MLSSGNLRFWGWFEMLSSTPFIIPHSTRLNAKATLMKQTSNMFITHVHTFIVMYYSNVPKFGVRGQLLSVVQMLCVLYRWDNCSESGWVFWFRTQPMRAIDLVESRTCAWITGDCGGLVFVQRVGGPNRICAVLSLILCLTFNSPVALWSQRLP